MIIYDTVFNDIYYLRVHTARYFQDNIFIELEIRARSGRHINKIVAKKRILLIIDPLNYNILPNVHQPMDRWATNHYFTHHFHF